MTVRTAIAVAMLLAVLPCSVVARQLRQDAPIFVPLRESNGVGNGNSTLPPSMKRLLHQYVPSLRLRHPAKWSPPPTGVCCLFQCEVSLKAAALMLLFATYACCVHACHTLDFLLVLPVSSTLPWLSHTCACVSTWFTIEGSSTLFSCSGAYSFLAPARTQPSVCCRKLG